MNCKNLILTLLFLSLSGIALSQKVENYSYVNRDSRIDRLIEKHRLYNQANPGVDGFRVQIFLEGYPDVIAYLTFKAPYYRVRVGDFRTKLEAEGFLFQLTTAYPNAFTVPDRIQIDKKPE